MAFCWHTRETDPPGTKPYITWGSPDECPVCHPELYEPYGLPVIEDWHSGGCPFSPEGEYLRDIIHCGQWLKRKKVSMDPTRQLTTPIAEVRAQAPAYVDSFGETWVMIDGIETKVPSLKAARALLAAQDATRVQIRADMDALGLRDLDQQEQLVVDGVPQVDADGEPITVGLLPPGDANYMQIGEFPDAEGLIRNAEAAQARLEKQAADEAAAAEHARLAARPPLTAVLDSIKSLFRKDGR